MQEVKHYKVKTLPSKPSPNSVYYVKATTQSEVKTYITDQFGQPFPLIDLSGTGTGSINSVTGTGVTGTNNNPVIDIATFKSSELGNLLQLSTTDYKLFVKPITSSDGTIDVNSTTTALDLKVSVNLQQVLDTGNTSSTGANFITQIGDSTLETDINPFGVDITYSSINPLDSYSSSFFQGYGMGADYIYGDLYQAVQMTGSTFLATYTDETHSTTATLRALGLGGELNLSNTAANVRFGSTNITQDITLEAPNKPAGTYTIATTDDISGPQTLAETLVLGNETLGRNIKVNNNDAIELENGSLLKKGSYSFGNNGDVIVSGITNTGDGYISGIMGWGNPSGTQWSDLNGTYIKTSAAVTPSAYGAGDIGMHTPEPGTYNYYLENPISLGTPDPAWNGIAYFLAPGNRSGWSDPDNNATTDTPVNYWRLCVLSDYPYVYFTNPSSDPYNFPTSGWVPIDNTIPNSEGGNGYTYISDYGGGFTVNSINIINGNGGISRICSVGYEDMWQAGIRYTFDLGGNIREATNCFNIVPDFSFDNTQRFKVGSTWTLDNGDTYLCTDATTDSAVWELQVTTIPSLQEVTNIGNSTTNSITVQGVDIRGNLANSVTNIGFDAGASNTGTVVTNLGKFAGENNTGDAVTNIGQGAGTNNTGDVVTNIGFTAGFNNNSDYVTNIGSQAGRNNSARFVINLGMDSGYDNALMNVINLGVSAQATDTNQLALNTGIANTVINLPATATELTLRDSASVEDIAYLSDITSPTTILTTTITDGDTTHAPDGNAVYDALVAKEPTITAGTTAQYWRGDKTWQTLPTSTSGGSSVFYYLNGSVAASVALYKQMSNSAIIGTGTDFLLAGNGLIAQFLTDVGNPNRLTIPGGAWNFEMFFSMSSNGGVPKFYVELLKYDGVTFTTIANNSAVPEAITSGTTIDLYLTSLAVPETTLLLTDRLAIRVYIVGNSGGRTATLHTEDSHLCQIITTFASGISAINGLGTNNQYLAVGTTGSDFNINSLLETHTFNLPTASATNRGALSSTNWSSFATKTFGAVFDGGGSVISAGTQVDVIIPVAMTIVSWTMIADVSGSAIVELWKDTYVNYPPTIADKITASAPPTITTATKNTSSTLTGWTTTVNAGDIIRFNVNSITSITKLTLSIQGIIT